MMKQIFRLCLVLFSLTLFSCSARIDGSLAASGSASVSFNMALEPRMTAMIRALAAAGGQTGAVIDGPSIARSMAAAPGVASASLRNTSPSAVEGQVHISRIGDFLSAADGRRFIVFEQRQSAGGRCEINISRQNGPVILELLSSEISGYLNALMAPLATGETLSKPEYLEIVSSFYNKGISDEIAASTVRASIEFPGNVTSVRGGTFSGRRANFNIPLIDLLVLETPLRYEVRWGQ